MSTTLIPGLMGAGFHWGMVSYLGRPDDATVNFGPIILTGFAGGCLGGAAGTYFGYGSTLTSQMVLAGLGVLAFDFFLFKN